MGASVGVDRAVRTDVAVGDGVTVVPGVTVEVLVGAASGRLVGVGPLATGVEVGTRAATLVGVDAPALIPQPATKSMHAATTNRET